MLTLDKIPDAARLLAEVRGGTSWADDPVLAWRVNALAAEVARRQGRALEATGLLRMAAQQHAALGYERPSGGFTLGAGTWVPPLDGEALWASLPDRLAEAARQDAPAAAAHERAAIQAALVERALARSPRHLPAGRGVAVVADGARLARIRALLARPGLDPADAQRLRRLGAPGRWPADARVPDPGFTLAPGPDEAILLYRVGADAGRVWALLPGAGPRAFALPGQAEVLAAPTLPVPWAADPELMGALADKTIWLIPDGPCSRRRCRQSRRWTPWPRGCGARCPAPGSGGGRPRRASACSVPPPRPARPRGADR
ncbi:MAG: hypothetical protein R3F60_08690 [bacterium]